MRTIRPVIHAGRLMLCLNQGWHEATHHARPFNPNVPDPRPRLVRLGIVSCQRISESPAPHMAPKRRSWNIWLYTRWGASSNHFAIKPRGSSVWRINW